MASKSERAFLCQEDGGERSERILFFPLNSFQRLNSVEKLPVCRLGVIIIYRVNFFEMRHAFSTKHTHTHTMAIVCFSVSQIVFLFPLAFAFAERAQKWCHVTRFA